MQFVKHGGESRLIAASGLPYVLILTTCIALIGIRECDDWIVRIAAGVVFTLDVIFAILHLGAIML